MDNRLIGIGCIVLVVVKVLALSSVNTSLAAESDRDAKGGVQAQWIWAYADEPAPKNRFTYFRKVVELDAIPEDATLHFAADSAARLWINGHVVRRKVARYHEEHITVSCYSRFKPSSHGADMRTPHLTRLVFDE